MKTSRILVYSFATACLVAEPAVAAVPGDMANLKAVAFMKGSCTKLVVAGNDGSRACKGLITNTMYKSGRSGFVFTMGDIAVVTFTGADTPAQGNRAYIQLDGVIFTLIGTGTAPNAVSATGTCTYTNPYAGPSKINCSALTKSGTFSGSFVSNGGEPDITEF